MPKPEDDALGRLLDEEGGVDLLVQQILASPDVARDYGYLGPGIVLAQRFEVGRRLGAGGMGHVVAAFDRALQADVALKMLGKMTPLTIARVKREFRSAADLGHPNLVRLHELFSDGAEWFFAMELVDGVRLKELGELDVRSRRFRDIFQQLARGIQALHQAGIVHADVKPSNFLITRQEERVVLLDFGLARPLGPEQSGQRGGTPAYMAPEQALGLPLTEASDWYAFGVVLYQALTGALPTPRPSPERLGSSPSDLTALCLELLSLAPEARPNGEALLRRIGEVSQRDPPSTLPPASREVFIGRSRELSRLVAAYEETIAGRPTWVLIEGPSGIGKTALGKQFTQRQRLAGALVIAGDCRERESMGYKAVDGLIDGLVNLLDSLPYADAVALLPSNILDLTVLFPALRAANVVADLPKVAPAPLNRSIMRLRAVNAFGELMRGLRERAPVVLWIDDVQWGDEESSLLLNPLIGGERPVPILLVVTRRSTQEDPGPLLAAMLRERLSGACLPQPVEIELALLDVDDATRMAKALLPSDRDGRLEIARDIGRDASGHPLFIAELVHAYRTSGQRPEHGPTTLAHLVGRRVDALPTDTCALLEMVAVAGAPLKRSVLRHACGLSLVETENALRLLKVNRLTRSSGLREQDTVDMHHDRIRDIIVQRLDPAERRRRHASLARAIDVGGDDKLELAAGHYEAAGELEQAGQLWLMGADRAATALAFNHAAELYAKGTRHLRLDAATLGVVRRRWALALAHAGKGPSAADVYLTAAESAPATEVLELRHQAAEQLLLSGHLGRGMSVIEQVLSALGMRAARQGRWALVGLAWGRFMLRRRGLGHSKPAAGLSRHALARLDASWSVACSLGVIDPLCGAEFQTRHLMLALDAGDPRRVLRALSVEASYAATAGAGTEHRTSALLSMADALAQQNDDPAALGLLCMARGLASYLQGRLTPALADLEKALDILTKRCPGAVWETITTRRFFVASLFFLGHWRRLSEVVPGFLAEAEGTGNLYASMCYRTAYSWATWIVRDAVSEGRRELDRAREEWKAEKFQLCHCNILIAECYLDLYEARSERALVRLETQWPLVRAAQLLRIGVLDVQMLQLRAALLVDAADVLAVEGDRRKARKLRREARRWAKRLSTRGIGRAAPLGQLLYAALEVGIGHRAKALEHLGSALSGFEREDMLLFAAAARARLGQLVGGSEGAALLAEARRTFDREGIVRHERVLQILAPGFRSVATSRHGSAPEG